MSEAARSPGDSDDGILPRSIFVPQKDPRKNLRETVDAILSDRFMAFLSILLIPIILLPFFFDLPIGTLDIFDTVDATVIVFFVVEYFAKLYLAENRWDYFKSPWHLVDLSVVVLSFISYLPLLGLRGKGSTTLLLRLLRLPRALAVGGRTAASRVRKTQTVQVTEEKPPDTIIRQVGGNLNAEQRSLTWEELEAHLGTREQEWMDIHNITEEGALRLSALLRVPPHQFKATQIDGLYPRIDYVQTMSFMFLQSGEIRYPERDGNYLRIARRGEIVVCRGSKIISASPYGVDMFGKALEDARSEREEHSFTVSVLHGILDSTLKEYRALFSEIEIEVGKIANTPRSKLPRDFLERMYELNKELIRTVTNLVHFKELLGVTITKKVPLEGFDDNAAEDFKQLQDETDYLNDVADDIVGRVRTIIDLYINQSSYETNRILKILAVITSLAIIPSALGGFLGMNLLDVPYPYDLWQVVGAVGLSMAFILYCFIKLGWLKS